MAHHIDGATAGSSAPDLFVCTSRSNPTSAHHTWRELGDGGARVALIIHPGDVAFRPGAFYVGVYSQLGGAHVVLKYYLLAVCYTYFATCCVLLATCYLLLTTFAPFFIGDYILSADVLEPSVDVPGLNAVGYALTMTIYLL